MMKNTLLTPFLFAILFTTASCTNQGANSYDFSEFQVESKSTADPSDAKERLDNAIARIRLKSITDVTYEDETLQKLQAEIAAARVARSNALLNEISTPEERIDISNVQISTKEDGLLILNIETIEEESNEKVNLVFESEESDSESVPFSFISGQNNHEVKARGYCIDLTETVCYNLVVEVSFKLKDRTVIRQFNFSKPNPKEDEIAVDNNAQEVIESVEKPEPVVVESDVVEEALAEDVEFVAETNEIIPISEEEEEETVEPVDVQLEVEEEVPALEAEQPTEAVDSEVVEEQPEEVKEEDLQVEEKIDEESSLAPKISLRPKLRPEREKVPSVRPVLRPDDFQEIVEASKHDSEAESIGGSLYILPEIETGGETPKLHFRDLGVEADSYADLDTSRYPIGEEQEDDELYNQLQTKIYNQSKGGYGGRLGRGRIKDASKLEDEGEGSTRPRVDNRSYGSGLTIDTLKWVGKAYLKKYPNDSLCVNHISKRTGGEIGHKSHENGLDIDMSIPSSANDCKRRGLRVYKRYYKEDRDFFAKNYDFLKMLIGTNKVHVIFVDSSYIRKICEHTKTMNLSDVEKEERKRIFKKLWHVGGHANHFHVRMKCNSQNVGCRSQAEFTPNVSTTCD